MERPTVDVVVPFLGSWEALEALCRRLGDLKLQPGDTVTVVDNGPAEEAGAPRPVRVLPAPELRTPGYARNRGAAGGAGEWIVFFDADTYPSPDLLDRFFDPSPVEATGLIAGGVRDEPIAPRTSAAGRYVYLRAAMSQDDTFRFGRWGYPKSANVAVRRAAFDALGGFREEIRAAEDADLTYRLRGAGWAIERRENATVVHRARPSLRGFAAQKLIHGAGGAWLEREYPGAFPARRRPGLIWWAIRRLASGLTRALWQRDRDLAIYAVFQPVENLAFEFGRSLPNERPLNTRAWLRALRYLIPPRGTPRI